MTRSARSRRSVVFAAGACLLAPPARAHSLLRRTSPAHGSVVRTPVAEIRLTFSQGVEAALSRATLKRGDAAIFEGRAFEADAKDRASLVLRTGEPLPPGKYTLDWRVMSIDTHMVEGRLAFEIRQ